MLQQQSSATPTGNSQYDAGGSDLSAHKANLANILKQVRVIAHHLSPRLQTLSWCIHYCVLASACVELPAVVNVRRLPNMFVL